MKHSNILVTLCTVVLFCVPFTIKSQTVASSDNISTHATNLTGHMVDVLNCDQNVANTIYDANYKYLQNVTPYLHKVHGHNQYRTQYDTELNTRNTAIRRVLTRTQWEIFVTTSYICNPIMFTGTDWLFPLYIVLTQYNELYWVPGLHHPHQRPDMRHPIERPHQRRR